MNQIFLQRPRWIRNLGIALALLGLASESAHAQQVTIGAPMTNVGGNFHENIGFGWNASIPTGNPAAGARGVVGLGPNGPQQGINFGFGGPGNAPAPFGLGNPNPAQLGWQVQGPNGGRLGFNLFADQGASTTLSSQTPMLTVMNGQQGYFASTVQRPFVTGLIPVVNDFGAGFAPTVVYPSMSIPWPNPNEGNRGASVVNERWSRIMANEAARSRINPPANAPRVGADQPVAVAPAARGSGRSSAERGAPSLAEIRRAQEADAAGKVPVTPPATKRLRLEE